MLVAVPLVYTGAMVSCFMQFVVYAGGTLVLEADFDPDRYLATIERHRVTASTTVPVIWERMADLAGVRPSATSRASCRPPSAARRSASTSSRPSGSVAST